VQNVDDLIIKAINYNYPSEIPISINFLPAAVKRNEKYIKQIIGKYPAFFENNWLRYDYEKNIPPSYHKGNFTDAWGCVWENMQEGMESYVTGHPLPNRHDILKMKIPDENIGLPHGFMYLRLLDLRGFEEAMMDFAEEAEELQILIDKVCEYNIRQMKMLCEEERKTPVIKVGDDLGMQKGLAIGAKKWRKYLKPAFKRIYDVCHEYKKYVYMHTDGDVIEIMQDIIDAGVHIINPQYRANGIKRLVQTCKGKIPIMLDLDRQIFPFGSPNDMRDHVRETVEMMYMPEGGLGLRIEIGMDVPVENMEAIIDEANKMRTYASST
jgi:uroporphyrinogen decarboxylase